MAQDKMKLYLVDYLGYHDEGAELVVAESREEAETKIAKWLDYEVYRCFAREVKVVDGYSVKIEKLEDNNDAGKS